jgi:flagellar assembly factor FliW
MSLFLRFGNLFVARIDRKLILCLYTFSKNESKIIVNLQAYCKTQ